jgi:glycerate dehydrogenase
MHIVVLDQITIGTTLDYSALEALGTLELYSSSTPEEMLQRVTQADVLIGNKVQFQEATLHTARHLKLICSAGTGYNQIDLTYAKTRGIGVCNVPAYSTDSVAQHTFALLFQYMEKINQFEQIVQEKNIMEQDIYTLVPTHFFELRGKTWGIIGLGNIGRRVAELAQCFGCRVIYYSTSGQNTDPQYTRVTLEELLTQSDIISIHAPLNDNTKNLLTAAEFKKMKATACLINVGRGGIANEEDLVNAVQTHQIGGACVDVFETEPIPDDSPYFRVSCYDNLILTPHIAWGADEARQRVIDQTAENIAAFLRGESLHRIV